MCILKSATQIKQTLLDSLQSNGASFNINRHIWLGDCFLASNQLELKLSLKGLTPVNSTNRKPVIKNVFNTRRSTLVCRKV